MPRTRFLLPLALATVLLAMPAPGVSAEPALKITPGLADQLAALDDGAVHGAFVHFDGGTPAQHRALLADAGLAVAADFESTANAVHAVGPVESIRALAAQPFVTRLEEDRLLTLHGDTAVWSSRARVVQENVSGGPSPTPPDAFSTARASAWQSWTPASTRRTPISRAASPPTSRSSAPRPA